MTSVKHGRKPVDFSATLCFYSNGQAAATYARPDLPQQGAHSVAYDAIRQNAENETSSSSFQTTAPRTATEPVYTEVNKKNNQHGAGHDADGQQYANIPAVQSAQITDQQVCTLVRAVFIALHGMQKQSSDEKAVRPSVFLSVKRVDCDKTEERSVQIFIPYERSLSLVF